ncbi:Rieske 2Fe-2S domain-containing protein [Parafrankia sp. FMc2]|uniref:Rieske 2Fe-2S domain-containing protein n=1 Tax=Parafrankia sp. FMc2 TaxID=3233196 RepID=UPI0034D77FDA
MTGRLTNVDPALRHGWHPVARSSGITDAPVGVRLLGEHWVLARLDGRLTAFADRCPHRLAPLSAGRVDGGELVCGYHGWRFAASGECTAVPALGPGVPTPRRARAVTPWGVAERHGLVWLAPEEPCSDIVELPEADEPGFDSAWLPTTRTTACAGLLADNFLDAAHLPFVHAATIGAGEGAVIGPYRVQADGAGFAVRLEQEVANPEDPGVAAGLRPLVQRRVSTYVYRPPFMLRLRLDYPAAGMTNTILFCLQPEDVDATAVYTRIMRDDLGGDPTRLAEAARFEQAVLDEDLALQEQFTLDGLPLHTAGGLDDGLAPGLDGGLDRSPTPDGGPSPGGGAAPEEVSIRADAAGVALRRVLAALVMRSAAARLTPAADIRHRTRPVRADPGSTM